MNYRIKYVLKLILTLLKFIIKMTQTITYSLSDLPGIIISKTSNDFLQGTGGDVIEGPGYQGGYGPPGPPV